MRGDKPLLNIKHGLKKMKKLQVFTIALLISLSVCAFAVMQAKGQDLGVGVSPASWTMDILQTATFAASPFGGSGTYSSYQWYVDSTPQGGGGASFTFVPASSGSYAVSVAVTDDLGATAQSNAASVTVNVAPTVSVFPVGSVTLTAGHLQTFVATPSGGSGGLSYQWYLDGSPVGSGGASYSYSAEGFSHSVTCTVTDSASIPVTSPPSNSVTITVNPGSGVPTPVPSELLTPGPSSPMLTPAPSSALTPPPSSPMLTPAPSSEMLTPNPSSTFILTPAPTETAPISVFGTVELLIIVVVIVVVVLILLLLVLRRSRSHKPAPRAQKSQMPSPISEAGIPLTGPNMQAGAAESAEQNNYVTEKQPKSKITENKKTNTLEIEIPPVALEYLKKYRGVFILTDFENPQYSYPKIKGLTSNPVIEFKEFVEVCKTKVDDDSPTEYVTTTFDSTSPLDPKGKDLGFYLDKSGFSTINDWVKTLDDEDAIPDCAAGRKIFYLYYVHTSR